MTNSKRIFINTAAQYIRTIINLCLSLYSTRLILTMLGESDFGIYSLVAGVVSMLSFITSALIVTTQRYMSFNQEKSTIDELRIIFNNSLILHLIVGGLFVLVLELSSVIVFDGFLEIPTDRISAAKIVYHTIVITLLLTFLTAPYKALTVAHENIIYSSVIEVVDGILKVIIAVSLMYIDADKLIFYSILLLGVALFNLSAYLIFSTKKYKECGRINLNTFDIKYIRELFSFTFWSIYSLGCIIGRTQGIAIVINRAFGTIVNAAYGIALTVNSAIQFVSSSICNAMNPQISKAEGRGDRQKMLRLSEIESKFCFLLLSAFAIPAIFEMKSLLDLWLVEYPENTAFICQMSLVSLMFDQLTIGLGAANQAAGKIKLYSLVVNTIKITTIPIALISIRVGCGIKEIMIIYALIELICGLARLPFLKLSAGLSISQFVRNVFIKEFIPVLVSVIICSTLLNLYSFSYRFVVTFAFSIFGYSCAIFFFGLCDDERSALYFILNKKKGNEGSSINSTIHL